MNKHPGEVIFEPGDLVQVYRSDLAYTFSSTRKLLPRWSAPRKVVSRNRNSYRLETVEGVPLESTFSSRCLRLFEPHAGTTLFTQQVAWRGEEGAVDQRDGRSRGNIGEGLEEEESTRMVGDEIEGGRLRTGNGEEENEEDSEALLLGDGLVDEVVQEIEGSWTRRGRRYDGGGHM